MKRRGFFRAIAGAAVAPSLPAAEGEDTELRDMKERANRFTVRFHQMPPAGDCILVRRADGETEWALPEQIERLP